MEDWAFEISTAKQKLISHFQTNSLEGFGIQNHTAGISAAGAVMHYLSETQHDKLQHITRINPISQGSYVWLDHFTQRNLELFRPNHPEGVPLINIVDQSKTAMGARLLRRWLAFPLKDLKLIEERQKCVKEFLEEGTLLEETLASLKKIIDLERVMAKIATEKISPRALNQLADSLGVVENFKSYINQLKAPGLKKKLQGLSSCESILTILQNTLHKDAPVLVSKGKVIAEGFSEELDKLRNLRNTSQSHLDEMLERETERTQIPSLKISFNNVFGYYIEVRNTHKDKVPEEWVRKQTLVNAERYITEELKIFESEILQAADLILVLEQQLFKELIQSLQNSLEILKQNASVVAQWDVLSNFAIIAKKNNYSCPVIIIICCFSRSKYRSLAIYVVPIGNCFSITGCLAP